MTSLDEELGIHRREIKTDEWSASIGELFSLYDRDKLKINPVFQRFFRWSDTQKSLLVESVLLGFPIPPLFFAQNEDGVLEVVDGVQRLSTLLQLSGRLKGVEGAEAVPPLIMSAGQYLDSLQDVVWDEECAERLGNTDLPCLTPAQRSDIEFARLNATLIQRSSSGQSKYDVFRRLNSYGEPLTPQETRAALIASENGPCLEWLAGLARSDDAVSVLSLSERQLEQQYDVELVLRFFFLVETEELKQSELRNFPLVLDEYGLDIARAHPSARTDRLGEVFAQTMTLIAGSVGADYFKRYVAEDGGFRGAFLNTSFEALGTSIGFHLFRDQEFRVDLDAVAEEFWGHPELQRRFATGRSTEWRLSRYVPLGRTLLAA